MNCVLAVFASVIAITILLVSGCSQKQPSAPPAPPSSSTNPAAATAQDQGVTSDVAGPGEQKLVAHVAAGGLPTQYTAYFEQEKLTRLEETRDADQRRGSYEFYGARLVRYSGAAVDSGASVTFELSMQGAVESSSSDDNKATDAAISALRDRAQLLRSHALAQRAAHAHTAH